MKTMRSKKSISDYYRFGTNGKHYIYDCNTNGILELPETLFDSFPLWVSNPDSLGKSIREKFDSAVASGLLGKSRPTIKNPLDNVTHKSLTNISNVTFCITESCNLRCSYCTYGNRWHSHKHTTFETIKKALELIDQQFSEEIVIGFYGGEPLLSLPLIKQAVTFAKTKFPESKLYFNMTTNGTLINEDVANFLIENKFHLLISLDGPKETHDRNRKHANGMGSYDKIMESLALLKDKSLEYFNDFINFNMVVAPPINIDKINSFLLNELPLPPNRCTVSLAEQPNSEASAAINYSDSDYEQLTKLRSEIENNFIQENTEQNPFATLFYSKAIRKIAFRNRNDISNKPFVPAGQCIPGTQKIYVDIDGKLHICERVGDNNDIGSVNNKIDMGKINGSLNQFYNYSEAHCTNCFAKRLCGICLSSAIKSNRFNESKLKLECKNAREFLKRNIKSYVRIIDKNPDAFDNIPGFIRQKSFT